jgi:hypothetical protein
MTKKAGFLLRIGVWICLFLAIIVPSTAGYMCDDEANPPTIYYDFEEGSGATAVDEANGAYNTTLVNTPTWTTGKIGGGLSFASGSSEYGNTGYAQADADFTWVAWFKTGTTGSEQMIIGDKNVGNTGGFIRVEADNTLSIQIRDGSSHCAKSDNVVTNDNWHLMIATYNASGNEGRLYIDNKFNATVSSGYSTTGETMDIAASGSGDRGGYFDGEIDDVAIYNRILNATARALLWNSSNGRAACIETAVTDTLNITGIEPANSTQWNSQQVNFTVNVSSTFNFNCSLYINDTLNYTLTNNPNGTQSVDFYVTFPADDETLYNYSFRCINNETQENSSTNWFYVDVVTPTVSVDSSLASNQSIRYEGNFTAQLNCSDTFLYSMNVSLDGDRIFNISNLAGTSYDYNLSRNINNLTTGLHTIGLMCADGHTKRLIANYDYTKSALDNSIRYRFDKGWIKINPTNNGLFSKFDTKKLKDRYSFEVTKGWLAKDDLEFEVSSNHPLTIVQKKGYEGWIVSDVLGKWIDFETISSHKSVKITRDSPNKIRVLVVGVTDDVVTFNSIGDLNIVTRNYTFYKAGVEESFVNVTLEGITNAFTLNISRNGTYTTDADAQLFYNGTAYAPTKTTATKYWLFSRNVQAPYIDGESINLSFYWNFTINGSQNNIAINLTNQSNQSVYNMLITNCSGASKVQTLNFTVRNELTNALIVDADLIAFFRVWNSSSSNKQNTTLQYQNSSTKAFCIYPSWANFKADYYTEFSATGFDTRQYNVENTTLTNVTQYTTLFMLGTGNATDITINVVDEYDDGISGVNVEAWKYSLANNNYTLVEIKETDNEGVVIMGLERTDEQYKFLVKQDGQTIYESSTMELYQTEYTFRVVTAEEDTATFQLTRLNADIIADYLTQNFTATWNDINSLITRICMGIYQTNVSDTTNVYTNCSTASSGTIFYNISTNGSMYIGNLYVWSSLDGDKYLIDSASLDLRVEEDVLGTTDLLVISLIWIGTLAFIGIVISAEATVMLTILGIIIFYAIGFLQVASALAIGGTIAALIAIYIKVKRG